MTTATDVMAERVRQAAQSVIEEHHVPGIAIGVVRGDDLVYSEGFGYAEIESRSPTDPERRHRIASVTKTMVGLCAMALCDEGRLSLDARLIDLLPDVRFEGPAEGITVRHLLTHTSGIGEAPTRERLVDIANPNRSSVDAPGDFSTLYPEGVIVEVSPGSKWAYCNNGYAMLGEIIVRAEGAPLQDVMERRIWRPLGMTSTDIRDGADERITSCYHRAPNDDTRFQLERAGIAINEEPTVDGLNVRGKFTSEFNQGMRAAGGVQSTISDMAKYASALLRGGAGIVKPATFAAMVAPQYCPDARLNSWGLSFERIPQFGRMSYGHGGAYFGGWNSSLRIFPDENLAVIQHMNIMMDRPAPVFHRVLSAVLGASPVEYPERAADASVLESAQGTYELPVPGPLTNFRPQTRLGRVTIERDGTGLRLRSRWGGWKTGVDLRPADASDPLAFAARVDDESALVIFTRDAAGRINGLFCDELVRMQKVAQ